MPYLIPTLTFIIALSLFAFKYYQENIKGWTFIDGSKWKLQPNTDPKRAETLWYLALNCLASRPEWNLDSVKKAVKNQRIFAMPVSTWLLPNKEECGGNIDSLGDIYLPPDLSSLCHELAHRCEISADGDYDRGHEKWSTNGTRDADNSFREQL